MFHWIYKLKLFKLLFSIVSKLRMATRWKNVLYLWLYIVFKLYWFRLHETSFFSCFISKLCSYLHSASKKTEIKCLFSKVIFKRFILWEISYYRIPFYHIFFFVSKKYSVDVIVFKHCSLFSNYISNKCSCWQKNGCYNVVCLPEKLHEVFWFENENLDKDSS